MTNPVHLLSVAALLLASFLVGAVLGTLVRLIVLRVGRKSAAVVTPVAAAAPPTAPLVAAPVIAPLPVAPTPVPPPPAEVPVPDFAATMIALANEAPPASFLAAAKPRAEAGSEVGAMQPAHVAGETTSGIQVAAPLHETPSEPAETPAIAAEPRTADVIPFPTVAVEPATPGSTNAVVGGETVAIVDTSDLKIAESEPAMVSTVAAPVVIEAKVEPEPAPAIAHEDNFLFVMAEPKAAEPAAAPEPETRSDSIPVPVIAADAAVDAASTADLPVPEIIEAASPELAPVEDTSGSMRAEATAVVAEAPAQPESEPQADRPVSEPEPTTASSAEPVDEDAAMRAIEGNWSPRRAPKRIVRAVEAPEGANQAVAASARAVTAARRTAEAVIAEVAGSKAEAGRPGGLDGPRDGRKDDLTHIIGVLPVIETALNKLGIYHFDQIGELTDENIGWIEGHLGVPGRIARELWREQARELSAVLKPRRAAES